jgi:hypothetical protein
MKPSDAFGVIVRVAGLGFLLASIIDLAHLAFERLGLPVSSSYQRGPIATAAGFYFVVGIALIAGAGLITRLIYGRNDSN